MKAYIFLIITIFFAQPLFSQEVFTDDDYDQNTKIKHADPVFEDLTTELGARAGENEINVNFGYRKLIRNHHVFLTQLEFEFVPVNNLGFEVVLPYTVYFNNEPSLIQRPDNRMEFFQWGTQFTFLTHPSRGISMALGFRNFFEIESPEPDLNENGFSIETINYYPFLIFAKNWADQYFLLFSGGPELMQDRIENSLDFGYNINTAFHYAFGQADHFVGVEFNKRIEGSSFEMFVRPQVILNIQEDFILGAAFGIPVGLEDVKYTWFLRLAYEFR